MVHDFVVTARHLVVLLTPFVLDPDRFLSGHASFLDAHVWRPELGARVLAVDKDTLEPVRRYELPSRLPLPPWQRLGGGGRHNPSRFVPSAQPCVSH